MPVSACLRDQKGKQQLLGTWCREGVYQEWLSPIRSCLAPGPKRLGAITTWHSPSCSPGNCQRIGKRTCCHQETVDRHPRPGLQKTAHLRSEGGGAPVGLTVSGLRFYTWSVTFSLRRYTATTGTTPVAWKGNHGQSRSSGDRARPRIRPGHWPKAGSGGNSFGQAEPKRLKGVSTWH